MKRLVIPFLMILMIVGSCLSVAAESEEVISNGIYSYYIKEDNTATIVMCSDTESNTITIPEKIGGYKVTEIKGGAFSGSKECEGFRSQNKLFSVNSGVLYKEETLICYPAGKKNDEFIIPRGKTAVESYAFVSNPYIREVALGDVTVIPEGCFAGCTGLESVELDDVVEIEDSAFAFCEGIKKFEFPKNLRVIGDGAFYGCKGITELKLGDEVEKIGKMAFEKCLSVTEFCIPPKVTSVEDWIYSINPDLNKVTVSKDNEKYKVIDNVLYSGEKADTLVFCPSTPEALEFVVPEHVNTIGRNAFENHKTLKKIVFSDSVQEVKSHAFYGCLTLESLELNNGLLKIGDYAFFGCEALGDVKIYASTEDVGNNAFGNCSKINLIVAGGSGANQYAERDNVNFVIDPDQEAVTPGYWADRYIKWSETNEITDSETDYKETVTREGCSKLVVNFYESITGKEAPVPENPFSDIDSDVVSKAFGLGILNGVGDGKFNPTAPITRQELCVCLMKLVTLLEGEIPEDSVSVVFRDSDKIAEWARLYVDDAYKAGIITGFPDGKIVPGGNATIEEALVMFYNISDILG